MAAGRSHKSLVGRRRRLDDEGDDDENVAFELDSESDGSVLSDGEEENPSAVQLSGNTDTQPENSHPEPENLVDTRSDKTSRKGKKNRKKQIGEVGDSQNDEHVTPGMESALNGLSTNRQSSSPVTKVPDNAAAPKNTVSSNAEQSSSNGVAEIPATRQRRDYEDYKKKRDTDPSFIPNRGTFFMHDTRQSNGLPYRGAWQGRGRGRGTPSVGGSFSLSANNVRVDQAAEQAWKHDLHDTINEESTALTQSVPTQSAGNPTSTGNYYKQTPSQNAPRNLSFSSTTIAGKIQIRVALPGMKAPVTFSEVTWRHYVRLPNHRPPLRRDKPVRISIPPNTQRYIFPSSERSFIFIPRQMRPNQQGYSRGGYQRSAGGYGYSSRRTSMYGGSVYAASVAASRRSSLAGTSRADAFSPTSFGSAVRGSSARPVVRLPHGRQSFSGMTTPSGPLSGQHTPIGTLQVHTYPLPQQPAYQGTATTTMHQPRPQKTISVTGVESPVIIQQSTPHEQQPFQSQLPPHMTDPVTYSQGQPFYSPRQHNHAYMQQLPPAAPSVGIPDQMMAQNFAPPMMPPYGPNAYFPQYPSQQSYYYQPGPPQNYGQLPVYLQAPTVGYNVPVPSSIQQTNQSASQPSGRPVEIHHQQQSSQSGMVAHESNGMVYYMPASEVREQSQTEDYQPAEGFVPAYAMPGLPPPTPAPEASTSYYAPLPVSGMPDGYYPAQQ